MIRRWMLALVSGTTMAHAVWAQDLPEWVTRTRISGLAFGDAYVFAANHDSLLEGENGFWVRRVYLTFDNNLSEQLAFRLRFEANSPGDFASDSKLEPFVKDLYVRWGSPRLDVYLGISSTPIWAVVQPTWGYRSVEKTPLDLQKLGSSRDFGVAVRGRLDEAGVVRYHAQLGNGSGTRAETNEGKKTALSLGVHTGSGIIVEAYADYEDRPGNTDRATFQVFGAWVRDRGRVGVLAARQGREQDRGPTLNLDVASIFGVLKVNDRFALLGRYDRMFDPNPDADGISYLPMDATAKSNLLLLGVDVALEERFHLIPNLEAVFYDGSTGATTPDADVVLRTTFDITF